MNHWLYDSFIFALSLATIFSLTGYLGKMNIFFELTSPFKLQYLVIGFCCCFFFLFHSDGKWVIVSLICTLINLVEIVPWYLPKPKIDGATISQIRVFQSNVLFDNQQYDRVISLVNKENPDIAVFVEFGEEWAKQFEFLKDDFPYFFIHHDNQEFGTAIYSKLPLDNSTIEDLGGSRKTLVTNIEISGQFVSVVASHLNVPTSNWSYEMQKEQLLELADYLTKIPHPILALGDWNITMWSPHYKQFIAKTKLKNARYGFGLISSWPTYFPFLSIPIDQLVISPEIKVLNIRTGSKVGSDHFPLITDLVIPHQLSN